MDFGLDKKHEMARTLFKEFAETAIAIAHSLHSMAMYFRTFTSLISFVLTK